LGNFYPVTVESRGISKHGLRGSKLVVYSGYTYHLPQPGLQPVIDHCSPLDDHFVILAVDRSREKASYLETRTVPTSCQSWSPPWWSRRERTPPVCCRQPRQDLPSARL